MLNILLAIIASYTIGSIPTSLLVGRLKGIDVRKKGSGNVGATNVLRTVGKLPALFTLIADILKGVVAVTFIATLFYKTRLPVNFNLFRTLLGISVIAGHNWSIFLKLKGGKGVATSVGVLTVLLPKAMAVGGAVFLIALLLTKYVSLGSILLSITVPIAAPLLGYPLEFILLSVTICILISYKHKSNVKRLLSGTESKIGNKS